jgi:hypothetical protein
LGIVVVDERCMKWEAGSAADDSLRQSGRDERGMSVSVKAASGKEFT